MNSFISIEETAMLSGICPLCLGVGYIPREEPSRTCSFCFGSGTINITKEKKEEIMVALVKRSQDSSCSL